MLNGRAAPAPVLVPPPAGTVTVAVPGLGQDGSGVAFRRWAAVSSGREIRCFFADETGIGSGFVSLVSDNSAAAATGPPRRPATRYTTRDTAIRRAHFACLATARPGRLVPFARKPDTIPPPEASHKKIERKVSTFEADKKASARQLAEYQQSVRRAAVKRNFFLQGFDIAGDP
ncbi:hypothetical protein [Streptomyces sp. Amel2xC10]|uniref:hypothetical protein n=1 Tax=Streptomyces sp. Amel2xC10 TaxID=1305826 RepID=UPI00211A7FEA|nr:hypothetical protein [Streptomyces sp. Amel2xC10]